MMLPSAECSDQLVIFASCLPFIGASPNNSTDFPPQQCCDDVSAAFMNGSAICVCYLILEPDVLGFPLNSSQLLSLTSICPRNDQTLEANFSLQTLCSDSAKLPTLGSITGSNKPKLDDIVAESPPPQELRGDPWTEKNSPYVACSSTSSPSHATETILWLRFTVIGLILLLRFSISYQQYANSLAELT